MLWKR